MGDVALRMSGIRKAFGNVTILNDVALEVNRGEVRALLDGSLSAPDECRPRPVSAPGPEVCHPVPER